jgi:hypothetical protein
MSKIDKKRLFYILLSVFVISLVYRGIFLTKQKTTPLKFITNKIAVPTDENIRLVGNTASAEDETHSPKIDVSELKEAKKPPLTSDINIFETFSVKKPPLTPLPEIKKTIPPPVNLVLEELKLFKFLGFIEGNMEKQIFLSKGDNVYIVVADDIIEDKFKVRTSEGIIEVTAITTGDAIKIPATDKTDR